MSEVPTANIEEWKPRTEIGRLVKEGKVKSIDDIFIANARIQEPEIVDALLTNLKYEVLSINIVQRQTDAGEVSQFQVAVALGNEDGYVGIGVGKARQIGPAMEKAIREAKVNIIPVRRGCGSWYCSCDEPHSVPFVVKGKAGTVIVELIPAPKGVGLVAGDTIKPILRLAGIKDVWSRTLGETRTTLNFAMATWNALKNTYMFKI
jgi:small subunit ribosomal protein S5